MPVTWYARSSDGSQIAYQVIGDGAVNVLVAAPNFIPVDLLWDEPRALQFQHRLSSSARHIWFDFRGTGASSGSRPRTNDSWRTGCEDMIAVIDEVGCERVAVVQLWGAGIGPLFAATHPGRTSAMVLVNTTARVRRADDYPEGWADEELEGFVALGGEMFSVEVMAPNLVADTDFRRWYRAAVAPGRATGYPAQAIYGGDEHRHARCVGFGSGTHLGDRSELQPAARATALYRRSRSRCAIRRGVRYGSTSLY